MSSEDENTRRCGSSRARSSSPPVCLPRWAPRSAVEGLRRAGSARRRRRRDGGCGRTWEDGERRWWCRGARSSSRRSLRCSIAPGPAVASSSWRASRGSARPRCSTLPLRTPELPGSASRQRDRAAPRCRSRSQRSVTSSASSNSALSPRPQQSTLEIALGHRRNEGPPPLTHEIATAFLRLIEVLSIDGEPVVVVVDDLQWIDAATHDVLAFALRRLPRTGVCVLLARRLNGGADGGTGVDEIGDSPDPWASLEGLGGETHNPRIRLQPLSHEAVEHLLRESVGATLPRPVLERVVAVAGGNPLFAVEFGRAMVNLPMEPGRPLPVPESLESLIAGRIRAMPAPTIEALAAVALLAQPSVETLADLHVLDDLEAAEPSAHRHHSRAAGRLHPSDPCVSCARARSRRPDCSRSISDWPASRVAPSGASISPSDRPIRMPPLRFN